MEAVSQYYRRFDTTVCLSGLRTVTELDEKLGYRGQNRDAFVHS